MVGLEEKTTTIRIKDRIKCEPENVNPDECLIERGRWVRIRFAGLTYSRIFCNSSSLTKGSESDGSESGLSLDVAGSCERPGESGAGVCSCG